MAETTIKVEGLRELLTALRKIDPDLKLEIKQANRQAATVVYNAAIPMVPVRTGRLRASVRVLASQRRGQVAAGKKSVPYAGPIHFGWRAHNIAPNPFLYKALDKRRNEVIRSYERSVDKVVRKAMVTTK
jgi:hypothetical protein